MNASDHRCQTHRQAYLLKQPSVLVVHRLLPRNSIEGRPHGVDRGRSGSKQQRERLGSRSEAAPSPSWDPGRLDSSKRHTAEPVEPGCAVEEKSFVVSVIESDPGNRRVCGVEAPNHAHTTEQASPACWGPQRCSRAVAPWRRRDFDLKLAIALPIHSPFP